MTEKPGKGKKSHDHGQAPGSKDVPERVLLRLMIDLPEGVAYIASLRRTTCCLLDSVGVQRADIEDIELLIGELATNAVMHAKGGDGYRVEVELHLDKIVLIVIDRGRGFSEEEITAAPGEPRANPLTDSDTGTEERFGGWGLPLVHSIADLVQILPTVPHGTTVRAEKRLEGITPP